MTWRQLKEAIKKIPKTHLDDEVRVHAGSQVTLRECSVAVKAFGHIHDMDMGESGSGQWEVFTSDLDVNAPIPYTTLLKRNQETLRGQHMRKFALKVSD